MSEPNLDAEYWDTRWQNDQTGWDIGYASTPLTEYFDQIENKSVKILIPGCGNAYEAEYLNEHGFDNVYVVDLSKSALEKFAERCPDFPEDKMIHSDFFELTDTFDLIVEQTFFCALDPKLRNEYVSKVHELLNPNGKLMGVLFNVEFGNPTPPYGGSLEEYLSLFQREFLLHTLEPCTNSIKPRLGNELFILAEKS